MSARSLNKSQSVGKAVSVPSKFAVLDALGLGVDGVFPSEGVSVNVSDSLPDDVTVENAMLVSDIAPDCSVDLQLQISPNLATGKNGYGSGGGKGLSKGLGVDGVLSSEGVCATLTPNPVSGKKGNGKGGGKGLPKGRGGEEG